ncbi:sn-glycerol-1-phosphate dehydrogenase [Treponema sp. OttesenSCG-928-L16]|nr:sn-glycerol-1-phosphate dehydrogenase [Treponema sp. OttesenSCG-928-L16]
MSNNKTPIPSLQECLDLASETDQLLLGKGVLEQIPELLGKHYQFSSVFLVCDENTLEAAGKRVLDILAAGQIQIAGSYIFPGKPTLHAEYGHVTTVLDAIKGLPSYRDIVPIAVGSGTLNDIVKRAAFKLELPYLCVPTASSVDGYTAYGSALLAEGFKETFPCSAPRVLVADSDILSAAPAYLNSSGFGDLAGKLITGTDWTIAQEAGEAGAPGTEPINDLAWAMTQTGLKDALRASIDAHKGSAEAVLTLFKALSLTGFAMQYMRSSRPVSGCEHLFSHIWEMGDLSVNGRPVTHGHKVAMGTLAATAFTEILFSFEDAPRALPGYQRPAAAEREAEICAAFAEGPIRREALKVSKEKLLDRSSAEKMTAQLRDNWKDLRRKVLDILTPYDEIKDMFRKSGCPIVPKEINLTRAEVIATARKAQMIRNRYSALDLAWDFGVMEDILRRLEAEERYLN